MKNKFLSKLLLALAVCGTLAAYCGTLASCGDKNPPPESSSPVIEEVDYAGQVKLDMDSTETFKEEVTVKSYIDGDTTHFHVAKSVVDNGLLKARYLAVNTPESTGKIEEWGKKASNFTKEKLKSASSIVLETDANKWEVDSTGDRHLVWVWYKPEGASTYRNLNVELLQNGLAIGSKAGSTRYGSICTKAINQAIALKLHVHSKDADPDFFYGEANEVDLKELRINIKDYTNQKVAFEGVVSTLSENGDGVFVESYDSETDMYYGMYVYYGYFLSAEGQEVLSIGNKVRIVGNVQYYEAGDSYQVSDVKYNKRNKKDPDSIQLIEEGGNQAAYKLTDINTFLGKATVDTEDGAKTLDYADLALETTIAMNGLKVDRAYTTSNEDSASKGAISLYCSIGGKEITVRTAVLKDEDGNVVTQDYFVGKTIDVKGIIDSFNGEYQIKVLSLKNIVIH